jgi:hypothetical protein
MELRRTFSFLVMMGGKQVQHFRFNKRIGSSEDIGEMCSKIVTNFSFRRHPNTRIKLKKIYCIGPFFNQSIKVKIFSVEVLAGKPRFSRFRSLESLLLD